MRWTMMAHSLGSISNSIFAAAVQALSSGMLQMKQASFTEMAALRYTHAYVGHTTKSDPA